MIPFLSAIPGVIASKATYHAVKANGGSKEEALAAGTGVAIAVSAVMLDPAGGAVAHAATHVASHAAGHVASHAAGHAAGHATGHVASHAAGHAAGHSGTHAAGHGTHHAASSSVQQRTGQSFGPPNYNDGQHVEFLDKAKYGDSSLPTGTQGVVSHHHTNSAGQLIDQVKVDQKYQYNQPLVDIADKFLKIITT